jgi:hypothetical protein
VGFWGSRIVPAGFTPAFDPALGKRGAHPFFKPHSTPVQIEAKWDEID